jgi:hypothetical protein
MAVQAMSAGAIDFIENRPIRTSCSPASTGPCGRRSGVAVGCGVAGRGPDQARARGDGNWSSPAANEPVADPHLAQLSFGSGMTIIALLGA